MIENLLTGFALGNAAILTNVCLLPLYPGLIAFLAGNAAADTGQTDRQRAFLGVFVLAGVLTMMLLVGLLVYLLFSSFEDVLPLLLPLLYGVVIVLGALLLLDRSPFAQLSTVQAPMLQNPFVTAYLYGLLLGPMTLPCTGPLITGAFALGSVDGGLFVSQMLYFLAFGLGFGWPLVVLPFFALPVQRRFTGWLNQHHQVLTRVSGLLLVAIGLLGIITEVLPALA